MVLTDLARTELSLGQPLAPVGRLAALTVPSVRPSPKPQSGSHSLTLTNNCGPVAEGDCLEYPWAGPTGDGMEPVAARAPGVYSYCLQGLSQTLVLPELRKSIRR